MIPANKNHLLLLLERPLEPVFTKRGSKNSVFVVPKEFLLDRYKPIQETIDKMISSHAGVKLVLKKTSIPSLDEIQELGRRENFSLFFPKHQKIADRLIKIFMDAKNDKHLVSLAAYVRDRVNPYLFNYALSVAILHRPDTKDLQIPSFVRFFPSKFLDGETIGKLEEEINVVPVDLRQAVEVLLLNTANDSEIEHRVAYFREDIGANLHHWHWHLVYPHFGGRSIVNKDRRGELFAYMHQQIIARYNFERLCNKMKRVTRLLDWRSPIEEAYFPKLDSSNASRGYPGRVVNQKLQSLSRDDAEVYLDVEHLYRWRERIYDAIYEGAVLDPKGCRIKLTEKDGIDILGNIVESSELSINQTYYGDLHNTGHTFISYIHDPDGSHLEQFGVMGDTGTSMRDPIFYRWHAFIDDIFQEYKNTLPRYTEHDLNYPDVKVTSVSVNYKVGCRNHFDTFWQQSEIDVSKGMDFQEKGPAKVKIMYLQHRPFVYNITVDNKCHARKGTCRIFLTPMFDESNKKWLFREQKNMMIELDKFTVYLQRGQNLITRKSSDSSVTIPFEQTFNDPEGSTDGEEPNSNFCGCGWPDNLLIPKGNAAGFPCQLFVMISNYKHDSINQTAEGSCNDSASYCGLKDKLYPDRRAMGYPFDRPAREGVKTLEQFLTPNMYLHKFYIYFHDVIEQRPK